MIRRSILSGLVAATALSASVFASADAPGIPVPPNAAPPFTIPSAPPIPAPPSNPAPPAPPTTTPTANPTPTTPLPGTSNSTNGLTPPNGNVGPGMNTVSMPSGDSNFNGYSQDQYNQPDPTSAGTWYGDMYEQVYNSYYEWGSLETWAYANYYNKWKAGESYEQYKDIYELYVYAAEARYYLQNYFWTYYSYDGKSVSPRYYDFSYEGHNYHTFSWKGYFAYNFYYYIDWMYKAYLGKAATYYKNHPNDYDNEVWWGGQSYGKYSDHCANMKYYMHGLENVEYGYDSTDTSGYHDWHVPLMETSAGF